MSTVFAEFYLQFTTTRDITFKYCVFSDPFDFIIHNL